MGDPWRDIWADQYAFNRELRADPADLDETSKCRLTGDLALHLMDEVHELLRHVKWKKHRRNHAPVNPRMIREELIDIYKMWMTLAQVWEPDLDALAEAYWEKSAVVRRRHAEEFLRSSQRPCAVIDLDNVLADFTLGFAIWLSQHVIGSDAVNWVQAKSPFPQELWRRQKHDFYMTGGFRLCPLMDGAQAFVDWCRDQDWNVVFLTSRSIDRYPSILTDTVWWMGRHDLVADFVWWGTDKPAKLEQEDVLKHVQLVVDDDANFIQQYVESGVRDVVWLRPGESECHHENGCWQVPSLNTIMEGKTHVFR